jgi:hypothetical protein
MAKIAHIRVVKAYLLELDCGHQLHRPYKQGVPQSPNVDCPQCIENEDLEDPEEEIEKPSAAVIAGANFLDSLENFLRISVRICGVVFVLATAAVVLLNQQHHHWTVGENKVAGFILGASGTGTVCLFVLWRLLLRWIG